METLTYPNETKARKEHNCDFCYERILKNEKYLKSTHVYDGRVYDWKTHKSCAKIADTLKMYDDCDEGLTADHFQESISDKHFDLLYAQIPQRGFEKYRDILQQLRRVVFGEKLRYVIRYFNKIE